MKMEANEITNGASVPPSGGETDSSARILVVDDEPYMRNLLVKTLNQFGYKTIDTAGDGADAWRALHETSYRLVITDQKMPKVTGLELIKRMRHEEMMQPVILLSGTLPAEELGRNPGLRVDAMLSKPVSTAELLATMEKLLQTAENDAVMNGKQIRGTREQPNAQTQDQIHSPARILLVDDDRDRRHLNSEVLTSSGYNVEGVNDGAAGWEALRTYDYDLVITDNHMPRMTGLEMIEKLNSARMEVPIIMATGNLPMDEFDRKPWLKPDAMLQKPYTPLDLLNTVRKILNTGGAANNGSAKLLPKIF